jgi:hypothetical protein
MHLKLVSTMILAKLVTSIKVAITCLGIPIIPIIQKNNQIKYINCKAPLVYTRYISHCKILNMQHLVKTYTSHLIEFDRIVRFIKYNATHEA